MTSDSTFSRRWRWALRGVAVLAIFVLAGCPPAHNPPRSDGPPPGYEPPPPETKRLFRRASYRGKAACPRGSFYDPRRGGQCWSCNGLKRTVFGVTGKRACKRDRQVFHSRAIRGKRARLAWNCKRPYFWDGWRGGYCWRCKAGYKRSASHINSPKSCVRRIKAQFERARFVKNYGCRRGQHFDRKGRSCWTCPRGYRRTSRDVKSRRACRLRG